MIHYITTGILIFTLAVNPVHFNASTATCAAAALPADDWKTLSEANYTISYPAAWQLDQSKAMGTTFILFASGATAGMFRENVNLLIQDLTGMGLDLDKYVQISEQQFKTLITDGNVLSSKRTKNDKTEFHEITATGRQGVLHLKYKQRYWVLGNKAYVLTFTALQSTYDDYAVVADKVLGSFAVK